ncbi:hypothetical protein C2G38_616566 [Gigaspora rosea]|uniref:Uncharacterized protein n=1 Tax=Gigaspora rosea TaxID=44941 RepID=A0A397U4M7_9GLOM|nr:hypothetical protein C2G38_616566 [Gigaspora rosea]
MKFLWPLVLSFVIVIFISICNLYCTFIFYFIIIFFLECTLLFITTIKNHPPHVN